MGQNELALGRAIHHPIGGFRQTQDVPLGLEPLALGIDDFIASKTESIAKMPGISAEGLLRGRKGILTAYSKIREKTGPLDMLVYPACAGDVFPILTTPTLVMIDAVPFNRSDGPFSEAVAVADANPSRAFSFRELANDPQIGRATVESLLSIQERLPVYIEKYVIAGYQPYTESVARKSWISDIMSGIYALGVNPLDVSLQTVRRGHKLSFDLEGEHKQIYFAQAMLPHPFEGYNFVPNFMDIAANGSTIGRKGLIIKADFGTVTDELLDAVYPDVVIHDLQYLLEEDSAGKGEEIDNELFGQYDREFLGGDPSDYNDIRFGYLDSPTQIVVCRLKTPSENT